MTSYELTCLDDKFQIVNPISTNELISVEPFKWIVKTVYFVFNDMCVKVDSFVRCNSFICIYFIDCKDDQWIASNVKSNCTKVIAFCVTPFIIHSSNKPLWIDYDTL